MRERRRDLLVVAGKYRHCFCATQLQQDVMFGIEVQRCHRIGARNEDKGFLFQHRTSLCAYLGVEFGECFRQKDAIDGVLLDEFQDHPRAILFDAVYGVGYRQTVAWDILEVDAHRQITAIILDVPGCHPPSQCDERIKRKQWMVRKSMLHDARLLGIKFRESCRVGESAHGRLRNAAASVSTARAAWNTALRRAPARGTVTRTISRRSAHRLLIMG